MEDKGYELKAAKVGFIVCCRTIVFYKKEQEDYVSLTDIAKIRDAENPSQIISVAEDLQHD